MFSTIIKADFLIFITRNFFALTTIWTLSIDLDGVHVGGAITDNKATFARFLRIFDWRTARGAALHI